MTLTEKFATLTAEQREKFATLKDGVVGIGIVPQQARTC